MPRPCFFFGLLVFIASCRSAPSVERTRSAPQPVQKPAVARTLATCSGGDAAHCLIRYVVKRRRPGRRDSTGKLLSLAAAAGHGDEVGALLNKRPSLLWKTAVGRREFQSGLLRNHRLQAKHPPKYACPIARALLASERAVEQYWSLAYWATRCEDPAMVARVRQQAAVPPKVNDLDLASLHVYLSQGYRATGREPQAIAELQMAEKVLKRRGGYWVRFLRELAAHNPTEAKRLLAEVDITYWYASDLLQLGDKANVPADRAAFYRYAADALRANRPHDSDDYAQVTTRLLAHGWADDKVLGLIPKARDGKPTWRPAVIAVAPIVECSRHKLGRPTQDLRALRKYWADSLIAQAKVARYLVEAGCKDLGAPVLDEVVAQVLPTAPAKAARNMADVLRIKNTMNGRVALAYALLSVERHDTIKRMIRSDTWKPAQDMVMLAFKRRLNDRSVFSAIELAIEYRRHHKSSTKRPNGPRDPRILGRVLAAIAEAQLRGTVSVSPQLGAALQRLFDATPW